MEGLRRQDLQLRVHG